MKMFIISILLIMTALCRANSQNLFFGAKSGYGYSFTPNRQNYSQRAGYLPVQLSLGGGLKNLQIGCDFIMTPMPASYIYYDQFIDEKRLREESNDTYIGGFLRYNTSPQPETKAGFILKGGAGLLMAERVAYNLPSDTKHETESYQSTVQFLGETGVTIPLKKIAHIYLGAGVRYAELERQFDEVVLENYRRFNFVANLGVSVNLHFQEEGEDGGE